MLIFIIQPTLTFYTGNFVVARSIVFLKNIHYLEPPLFHNFYSNKIFLLQPLKFGKTKRKIHQVDHQDGDQGKNLKVYWGLWSQFMKILSRSYRVDDYLMKIKLSWEFCENQKCSIKLQEASFATSENLNNLIYKNILLINQLFLCPLNGRLGGYIVCLFIHLFVRLCEGIYI